MAENALLCDRGRSHNVLLEAGYRPNTNAHAAVRKGEVFIRRCYHWVVDADIEGFFDHVDHQIMMDLVCEKVADGRVLSLIESFLKSGIMNDGVFEESMDICYSDTPMTSLFSASSYQMHKMHKMHSNEQRKFWKEN